MIRNSFLQVQKLLVRVPVATKVMDTTSSYGGGDTKHEKKYGDLTEKAENYVKSTGHNPTPPDGKSGRISYDDMNRTGGSPGTKNYSGGNENQGKHSSGGLHDNKDDYMKRKDEKHGSDYDTDKKGSYDKDKSRYNEKGGKYGQEADEHSYKKDHRDKDKDIAGGGSYKSGSAGHENVTRDGSKLHKPGADYDGKKY